MFISNDSSQNEIKKEIGLDTNVGILDESLSYSRDEIGDDLKSELELSDDSKLEDTPVLSTLVPLEAGNISSGMNSLSWLKIKCLLINLKLFMYKLYILDDIKHKIEQLQNEIEELKERKKQQDMEIANIENINLRERFINISNNLFAEQLDKEQQVFALSSYSF